MLCRIEATACQKVSRVFRRAVFRGATQAPLAHKQIRIAVHAGVPIDAVANEGSVPVVMHKYIVGDPALPAGENGPQAQVIVFEVAGAEGRIEPADTLHHLATEHQTEANDKCGW